MQSGEILVSINLTDADRGDLRLGGPVRPCLMHEPSGYRVACRRVRGFEMGCEVGFIAACCRLSLHALEHAEEATKERCVLGVVVPVELLLG